MNLTALVREPMDALRKEQRVLDLEWEDVTGRHGPGVKGVNQNLQRLVPEDGMVVKRHLV